MFRPTCQSLFVLLALTGVVALAQAADEASAKIPDATPEAVVEAYFGALGSDGLGSLSVYMHPEELARFQTTLMPVIDYAAETGEQEFLDFVFGTGATAEDVAKLSPEQFASAFMKFLEIQMEVKPQFERIDVLGTVPEGEDRHVLSRITVAAGELSIEQLEVVSLRPYGDTWRLKLTTEMEGLGAALAGH